ncbi:hypothetical protein N7532_006808 [Penicillium argentinense]|uniref:F5/8 type C domain-containing protein n=1 Tax=Penicillium argentinense TaxID=1131581 RepID=A0A9W9FGK3_9EURO|nr:uncharacterized protein N7532_006808 [Penicillium argentinense]KAJ5099807.1 hypothetical protein N7532_006808 [Penicillium argentinense]
MKLEWGVAALQLGTARGRDISELESLYQDGTAPDRAMIGGNEVATPSQPLPRDDKINRDKWSLNCTSSTSGNECAKAIDGSTDTFWQSQNSATEYQNITITLEANNSVSGLTVVPRQINPVAALIEQHQILVSQDNINWELVAYGTWWNNTAQKLSVFQPRYAKYLRLSAAASQGIAIADIEVYTIDYIPPNDELGSWGPTIDLPLVPVAGAVDPQSGEVVVWSVFPSRKFVEGKGVKTQTATWNPRENAVTRSATNTNHDMFCPGIATDQEGKVVVTGGTAPSTTSIYNTITQQWYQDGFLNKPRGYQASNSLSDGRIFVIGGSYGSNVFGKDGEVYDMKTNKWTMLPSALASTMLTHDQRTYRQDHHGWTFAWDNGSVFQAGPSKGIHWYGTAGDGSVTPAGNHTGDEDAVCSNAVIPATNRASIISITDAKQAATVLPNAGGGMKSVRTFHTSVVLPDGSVFVNGGQTVGLPFNETGAQLSPETFFPDLKDLQKGATCKSQQPNTVIRVYHSIALLLQDGTVFTGGGGLYGNCAANHFDG